MIFLLVCASLLAMLCRGLNWHGLKALTVGVLKEIFGLTWESLLDITRLAGGDW